MEGVSGSQGMSVGVRPLQRSVKSITQFVKREFISSQKYACCVPVSALLHELLQLNGYEPVMLRRGLLLVDYDGERKACFHAWVELRGHVHDLTHEITCVQVPEMERFPASLQESMGLPAGYHRIDLRSRQDVTVLVENNRAIDDYINGRPFWSNTPGHVQKIREHAIVAMSPRIAA